MVLGIPPFGKMSGRHLIVFILWNIIDYDVSVMVDGCQPVATVQIGQSLMIRLIDLLLENMGSGPLRWKLPPWRWTVGFPFKVISLLGRPALDHVTVVAMAAQSNSWGLYLEHLCV